MHLGSGDLAETWEDEEIVVVSPWHVEAEEVVNETHRKAAEKLEDLVLGRNHSERTHETA